jgi:mannose-6-phosphate isomerase-like protein (cupin superfamily)/DNA-binding Xre family transcriptional regulator
VPVDIICHHAQIGFEEGIVGETNKSGSRLASLRNERKISTTDLAARSGVSEAEIKAIESGLLSPSIAPLVKLSRALGVRLGTFLDDAGGEGPILCRGGQAAEVMRAPGQVSANMGALSFYSLAQGKTGRSMEPFIIDLRPVAGSEVGLSTHEGEEFIYVLQGDIEIRYGSEILRLATGDSIYYDSIVPHRVSSSSRARVLAVIYAPF